MIPSTPENLPAGQSQHVPLVVYIPRLHTLQSRRLLLLVGDVVPGGQGRHTVASGARMQFENLPSSHAVQPCEKLAAPLTLLPWKPGGHDMQSSITAPLL